MILVDDSNACRIVAAVFKLAQPIDNQGDDLLLSDVSDYSTHNLSRQ